MSYCITKAVSVSPDPSDPPFRPTRKMYEVPEFFNYAIADGLRWLFVKLMKTARGFARVR